MATAAHVESAGTTTPCMVRIAITNPAKLRHRHRLHELSVGRICRSPEDIAPCWRWQLLAYHHSHLTGRAESQQEHRSDNHGRTYHRQPSLVCSAPPAG